MMEHPAMNIQSSADFVHKVARFSMYLIHTKVHSGDPHKFQGLQLSLEFKLPQGLDHTLYKGLNFLINFFMFCHLQIRIVVQGPCVYISAVLM